METNRLQQFLVVAQTQNLRRAAEMLHVTHSALSKSLTQLKRELSLGDLFVREGRGIILTKAGRDLIPRAHAVLEAMTNISTSNNPSPAVRTANIATFEVFSTYFAANLVAGPFADWQLNFIEATPGQMEQLILSERADIGLTYEPIPMAGLSFRKIGRVRMEVYGSKSLLNSGHTLQSVPFAAPVIPVTGSPTGAKGLDGWNDAKFPRMIKYRVELLETALSLCRAGHAAVCAPDFLIKLHNQTAAESQQLHKVKWALPEVIKRNIFIIHPRGEEETVVSKKVAAAFRQVAVR